VELAEFPRAGSVVVRGILLDIAELEQLDVLIDGDLAKGIGPHHREYIWTEGQVGLGQKRLDPNAYYPQQKSTVN
jgi:hypothetical protein